MRLLKYTVNSLIEWKHENENTSIERVLWMDEELVYVIDVNKNSAPYLRSTADIDSALIDGRAVIKEDDTLAVILKEEDIPKELLKEQEKFLEMELKDKKEVEEKLEKYKKEICLLSQNWIKDENKTISDLLDEAIGKLGENIIIKKFTRYEL